MTLIITIITYNSNFITIMINYSKLISTLIVVATGWLQFYAQPLSTPDLKFFEVKGNIKSISYMNGSLFNPHESIDEITFKRNGFFNLPKGANIKRDINNKPISIGDMEIKWENGHISEINMNGYSTLIFHNNKGLCSRIVYNNNYNHSQDVMDLIYNKFDDYGNWIMRTAVNIRTGKEKLETRFITYYSDSELSEKALGTDDVNVLHESKDELVVEEKKEEPVFTAVEQMPQFPGGEEELMKYVSSNIKYPSMAMENAIQGRVVVKFVVTKTGKIGEVKVVRSKDPDLDKEAVRVVKSLPSFIPGKMNGQAVNVWYTLPITFKPQGN